VRPAEAMTDPVSRPCADAAGHSGMLLAPEAITQIVAATRVTRRPPGRRALKAA
jgi:hypothetical protein